MSSSCCRTDQPAGANKGTWTFFFWSYSNSRAFFVFNFAVVSSDSLECPRSFTTALPLYDVYVWPWPRTDTQESARTHMHKPLDYMIGLKQILCVQFSGDELRVRVGTGGYSCEAASVGQWPTAAAVRCHCSTHHGSHMRREKIQQWQKDTWATQCLFQFEAQRWKRYDRKEVTLRLRRPAWTCGHVCASGFPLYASKASSDDASFKRIKGLR